MGFQTARTSHTSYLYIDQIHQPFSSSTNRIREYHHHTTISRKTTRTTTIVDLTNMTVTVTSRTPRRSTRVRKRKLPYDEQPEACNKRQTESKDDDSGSEDKVQPSSSNSEHSDDEGVARLRRRRMTHTITTPLSLTKQQKHRTRPVSSTTTAPSAIKQSSSPPTPTTPNNKNTKKTTIDTIDWNDEGVLWDLTVEKLRNELRKRNEHVAGSKYVNS